MRNTPAAVVGLALLLTGAACSTQQPSAAPAGAPASASGTAPASPRRGGLVPGEALTIAQNAARARGIKVEAFANPQSAQLLIRNRHLVWAVAFVPKGGSPAPGSGPFTIFVDDQTGGTEFVAGAAPAN